MNCPICNKSGLPDYTLQPAVCPQCNSDLKAFLLIETMTKKERSLIKGRNLLTLAFSLFILITVFVIVYKHTPETKGFGNVAHQDSINYLKNQIAKERQMRITDSIKYSQVKYRIKRGDNLSKIAHIFYNDWSKYKIIQADNNLGSNTNLVVGDTLLINLNKIK